ncbi:hypothetical protein PE067_02210 [Paracoccus sp. DMF-8]|uniref:hypothetical protein n=1 Tax=Paracoccus sp. DMF-8 TaxID=3019445 RepID=UPI0023E7F1A3|nr:hypothetical protein [Paracoccus sp. DMF-8]MDF3605079.1 hypothetical protein [Paracoccus sp. DMF-8]
MRVPDRFVFNGGRDRITDFELDDDVIDVRFFNQLDSWADVRGAARQVGTDVVLTVGNNQLVIEDTRLNQLDRDDFIW